MCICEESRSSLSVKTFARVESTLLLISLCPVSEFNEYHHHSLFVCMCVREKQKKERESQQRLDASKILKENERMEVLRSACVQMMGKRIDSDSCVTTVSSFPTSFFFRSSSQYSLKCSDVAIHSPDVSYICISADLALFQNWNSLKRSQDLKSNWQCEIVSLRRKAVMAADRVSQLNNNRTKASFWKHSFERKEQKTEKPQRDCCCGENPM